MTQLLDEQGYRLLKEIETMTRLDMARLIRFAPSGHPIFSDTYLYERFMQRFELLGGWSPGLSKTIGWGR